MGSWLGFLPAIPIVNRKPDFMQKCLRKAAHAVFLVVILSFLSHFIKKIPFLRKFV